MKEDTRPLSSTQVQLVAQWQWLHGIMVSREANSVGKTMLSPLLLCNSREHPLGELSPSHTVYFVLTSLFCKWLKPDYEEHSGEGWVERWHAICAVGVFLAFVTNKTLIPGVDININICIETSNLVCFLFYQALLFIHFSNKFIFLRSVTKDNSSACILSNCWQ